MADIEQLQGYIPSRFLKQYEDALGAILGAEKPVRVFTHYDADGLSAGGLLCLTLLRAGIDFQLSVSRALDKNRILEIKNEGCELIAFCDMGSGQVGLLEEHLEGSTVVVFDHHFPLKESTKVFQVNPHFSDMDGTSEACASTVIFLFSIGVTSNNWDLYHLALCGAIGDKQHLGGLKGLNRKLLETAVEKGIIEVTKSILLDPVPLFEALYESLEPYFTGISGNKNGTEKFLRKCGIRGDMRADELPTDKRRELTSLLALRLASQGVRKDIVEGLVAERYYSKTDGTDVREFSNIVNACGRMGMEYIGIGYCMGDRQSANEASRIRKEYRAKVREGLLKLESKGPVRMLNIQYFHTPEPSIASSHAGVGMMFFFDQERPVLALSQLDGELRVSIRGTNYLVGQGLDLASACRTVAESLGGHGGGHNIAAGATVPLEKEKEFLDKMDEFIGKQLEADRQETA